MILEKLVHVPVSCDGNVKEIYSNQFSIAYYQRNRYTHPPHFFLRKKTFYA
jgi:hypothetical protein